MSSFKRELSNLSYTNKDFGQIYPELLDLAKKISYKWDPSLSDESDPGVVLLKLAALMADKCNYNIDKNILELFPMSVTQLANARQLFDQCGYTMRYFQSATTQLTFRMTSEPELTDKDVVELIAEGTDLTANAIKSDPLDNYLRHYIVPKFTMFSDIDNSIVYTILEDLDIPSNGNFVTVDAMQGIIHEYAVNGSTVVTADMLDSNNRIYFTELNIPENGIFIENKDVIPDTETVYWKQCDNLMIQPLNSRCYKFGLTLDGTRCYVEFPSDADTLIGSGITIHYLLTSGFEGNIKRKFISQFFTETQVTRNISNFRLFQDVELTTDNVYITNSQGALNGRNPETIDDAYKNYQKVKTTFNTLVSTKDYSNFLVTNKDLSNCVVCDRSDDAQSSYKVLTNVEGQYQLIPHVRQKTVSHVVRNQDVVVGSYDTVEPEMTAFDLRVYGLKYVDGFDDYKSFSKSFDVQDSRSYSSIESSTHDVKCLSHDYKEFLADRIILLKNRYPIVAKIVSPYKLALSQQAEILSIVKLKLFQVLNSQAIEFGQEVDYNLIYETILKADPRISAVILDDIQYETYAVYFSSSTNQIEHMRIDSMSSPPHSNHEQHEEFLKDLWKKFRTQIYATSILAGKTPLFVSDSTFVYSVAHEKAVPGRSRYDVNTMKTEVNIPLEWNHSNNSLSTRKLKDNDVITLTAPNLIMENRYANYCQFVTNIGCSGPDSRPNFDDPDTTTVISKGGEYALKNNEYIIFFWRTSDDPTEKYKYVKYTGRGADPVVICPSFNLRMQPHTDTLDDPDTKDNRDLYSFKIDDDFFLSLGDISQDHTVEGVQLEVSDDDWYKFSYPDGKVLPLNRLIQNYFIGERFNLKSNSIEVKKINKIHLNNTKTGTNNFYWILNHVTEDNKYQLFSADKNDTEYTLQDGEMLIYADERSRQLYVLGTGTKIHRSLERDTAIPYTAWECPALENKLEFLLPDNGPEYFNDSDHPWFNIRKKAPGFNLHATEMLYRKLGASTKLIITPPQGGSADSTDYYITSKGIRLRNNEEAPEFKLQLCSFTIENEFEEFEKLADRNHEQLAWSVSSSLNLKMSHSEPQRLYEHQTISWQPDNETRWYQVTGSDVDEIYIQSDTAVTHSGGSGIDVRRYNIMNEMYEPLGIYVYKVKDVDMSLSLDTSYYDAVWTFSDNEITVTGKDVSLVDITLPSGDYILPVSIDSLNPQESDDSLVTAFWTELRKLKTSKLTSAEKAVMRGIQTTGSSALPRLAPTDWQKARKPVELADVAKWIYGSAYVDVSDEFNQHTVDSAFRSLFVADTDKHIEEVTPGSAEFSLRSPASSEYDIPLNGMLVSYGGMLLKKGGCEKSQPHSYEIGDIICSRTDKDYETLYDIWIYAPTTVLGSEDKFIHVSSERSCSRKSLKDVDSVLNSEDTRYHYTLRPSNIPRSLLDNSFNNIPLKTVTDVVVNNNATYYYMLTSRAAKSGDSTFSYTLRLVYNGNQEQAPTYKIGIPMKYVKPCLTSVSDTEIDFFDDILEEISRMDTRNLFDYTYSIPESEVVRYPLDSISFLDANHPLNKFTICQYVINESQRTSELVVSGKSK